MIQTILRSFKDLTYPFRVVSSAYFLSEQGDTISCCPWYNITLKKRLLWSNPFLPTVVVIISREAWAGSTKKRYGSQAEVVVAAAAALAEAVTIAGVAGRLL